MRLAANGMVVLLTLLVGANVSAKDETKAFQRIATFNIFENTDIGNETVAEIVSASKDGKTLIYTDSELNRLGFVDITNPAVPVPLGTVDLDAVNSDGEPTSVAVAGDYALVGLNTSVDFINVSGALVVIHIPTQNIVHTIPLGGQPDCVAVSPNESYCVIAIENERDEDLGDGEPPQLPAGEVIVVDLLGPIPQLWPSRRVDIVGVCDLFPEDPEPEFVSINKKNIAAVTCQENNHVILIDLADKRFFRIFLSNVFPWLNGARIEGDFSCGTVSILENIDTKEEDPALIKPVETEFNISREPDAIVWIGKDLLATADEGDLFGGSRGFTVFDTSGNTVFESGTQLEHLTISIGHYPDGRSGNKGNEPEGITFGHYDAGKFLFVGSERSSVIGVYKVKKANKKGIKLEFVQVLPAGLAPEGLLCLPQRDLFVVASEDDSRGDKYRSSLSIYELQEGTPSYPTIQSATVGDAPIGWAALSALASKPGTSDTLYTVYDSFFGESRIFEVDMTAAVPTIVGETVLKDTNGLLAAVGADLVNGPGDTDYELNSVNLDPEGLAVSPLTGNFWVASEGRGTVGDASQPFETPNLICEVAPNGDVLRVVRLPAVLEAIQVRFGFEGITVVNEGGNDVCYVCVQREWKNPAANSNTDPAGHVKIGRYDSSTDTWTFAHYPLDAPTSPNGGWVGLSEIVWTGGKNFAVIERDNQAGADARIKRIYSFSLDGVTLEPAGNPLPTVAKNLVRNLIPDLEAPQGAVIEKVEGLTVLPNGDTYIVTDNDGVDDSNGETQLINLGKLFD